MDHQSLVDELAGLRTEELAKAVLDAKEKNALPDSAFAYIDSKGKRHLPVHDEGHVKSAISYFSKTHFESAEKKSAAAAKIRSAAKTFGIKVDAGDAVAKAEIEAGTAAGLFVTIEKADPVFGVIYGVASVANVVDHQGDVIRADELRKAAHEFLLDYNSFNDTHKFGEMPGKLVESWVDGDVWRVGFKPDDVAIAKAAADGEYVGFSIEGQANRVKVG